MNDVETFPNILIFVVEYMQSENINILNNFLLMISVKVKMSRIYFIPRKITYN